MKDCSLQLIGRHEPVLCSITVAPCEVKDDEECEIFDDVIARELKEDANAD